MSRALEGIRVIDWTLWIQGSFATSTLGLLGAEVIKIEQPNTGDPGRWLKTSNGVPVMLPSGISALFDDANRNKKGITLDLSTPKGKEIMYQLVGKSDAFVHNWSSRVAAKLGMDYKTLSRYNKKLVYASAVGFGTKGPYAGKPAHDVEAQARSGLLMQLRESEDASPVMPLNTLADDAAAYMFVLGIITALLAREKQGIGQEVTNSLFGSMLSILRYPISLSLLAGKRIPRPGRTEVVNPLQNLYRTSDGKWIALNLFQADRYWPILVKAIGMPQLEKDPKFSDTPKRQENQKALISVLDGVFAGKTCREWEKLLGDAWLPFSPVNTIEDLPHDPQVLENRFIYDFEDPIRGKTKALGLPLEFSETPWAIQSPSPALGQHTEEVLSELLGYSWEDMAKLREEGVI